MNRVLRARENRRLVLRAAFMLPGLVAAADSAIGGGAAGTPVEQRPIARVRAMAPVPDPLIVRDWADVSRRYYGQLLDPATRLDGRPLVVLATNGASFEMPSWVGGPPEDEAFTCLIAVIGARLAGFDPRALHGFDYVRAAKGWFDAKRGVYRHRRGQIGQAVYHADIYGYWAGIQGLMLASQYPDDADLRAQARAEAAAFLRIARGMGCPDRPDFDVPGFDFDRGVPAGRPEPMNRLGHAPSVAWPLLVGHRLTGDPAMLDCARTATQWHIDHPGRYEVSHLMGPLTAARLNAEHGCRLDLDRVLAAWFGEGDPARTPWKITSGTRCGGLTCDGLDGADWRGTEPGFHAFAMGTLQGPAWLVPVARYDPRYARDIGRYALHAAASARLLQGFGLDADHQDHKEWKDRWDPDGLWFYEALTSWDWAPGRAFRPYATGDAVRLGWGAPRPLPAEYHAQKRASFGRTPRNLALCMGNHVGFLGGIVALTDVPGILRWDCLATDWHRGPAFPTWLFYNPHPAAKEFRAEAGPQACDLHDLVRRDLVARNVRGGARISLPPDTACVLVAVPRGAVPPAVRPWKIGGTVVDFGPPR